MGLEMEPAPILSMEDRLASIEREFKRLRVDVDFLMNVTREIGKVLVAHDRMRTLEKERSEAHDDIDSSVDVNQ
jgi:hypothetical protein